MPSPFWESLRGKLNWMPDPKNILFALVEHRRQDHEHSTQPGCPQQQYEHISQLAFNITAKFLGWGSHSRAGLHPCRTSESYLSSLTWSQMQTGNQYSCLCLLVYSFSLFGVLFYVHHPRIRALLFTASKTIMCTNSGFQKALRGILGKAPCSSQVWDLARLRWRLPSVTVFMWQL